MRWFPVTLEVIDGAAGAESRLALERSMPEEREVANTTIFRPGLVLVLGTALAALAGLVYVVIGLGMAGEGFKSPPPPVMLAAGVAYLVGGGLILVADRRLLLVGAIVNAVVIALFLLSVARGNATLDALSLSGKAAQIALGMLLVWASRRRSLETNARTGPAQV